MKTPTELRYQQHRIGEQLLPYLAQRKQLRRQIQLINLPRLTDLFPARRANEQHPAQDHLPHGA